MICIETHIVNYVDVFFYIALVLEIIEQEKLENFATISYEYKYDIYN